MTYIKCNVGKHAAHLPNARDRGERGHASKDDDACRLLGLFLYRV